MTFDDICNLKVGDIRYECESGVNIRFKVTSEPKVDTVTITDKKHRTVRFEAINTENNEQINYIITEGLEHYGARIYTEAQYGYFDKEHNTWNMPLFGGEDEVYPFSNK